MSKVIVLDPGHGGFDPGATAGVEHEAYHTLQFALKLGSRLEASGVKVVYTRTKDETPGGVDEQNAELAARVKIAKDAKADLFLSLHMNAGKGKGTEIHVHHPDPTTASVALLLVQAFGKIMGFHGEPVKDNNFYVLRNQPHAMLLEMAFIDNPDDLAKFKQNQTALVDALARILIPFLGGDAKTPKPPDTLDYFGHAFEDSINYVKQAGLMNGIDKNGNFDPNGIVTRGQLAAVLHRLDTLPVDLPKK